MELILRALDGVGTESLINKIIKDVSNKKFETWEVFTQNKKIYLKHTNQWGERGVVNLKLFRFLKPKLRANILPFEGIENKLVDFEDPYLYSFYELIVNNYATFISSIDIK